MSMGSTQPPGWYHAEGDPPGTQRYWDGATWVGAPQPIGGAQPMGGFGAPVGAGAVAGRRLAEPKTRVLARLIDFVIAIVIGSVLAGIVGLESQAGLQVAVAIVGVAYEVAFTALKGGTPGKLILGIGVTTTDGKLPPGWGPAAIRWVVTAIPFIGFIVFIVSLVFLFTDAEHRTVGDRAANTRVVVTK